MTGSGGPPGPGGSGSPIGIGVIGFGYWGPKLVRNLASIPGCHVAGICDVSPDRLAAAAASYPGVEVTSSYRHLLEDPAVDAMVVSTPISTHYALALEALEAGKHVFVEKPLAGSAEQARHLVDEAASRGLLLMVGHVFLYAGAVRRAHEVLASERFGELRYYDSIRVNSEAYEQDVGAIWDLAVHDLSILDYLVAERPRAISATGVSHRRDRLESTAYLTVFYDSDLLAHVSVNWLAPEKVRRTTIGGAGQMIVYDELEPVEKLRVFDRGISYNGRGTAHANGVGARAWAPELDRTEALHREMEEFVASIASGSAPVADGRAGLRVVELLEAAARSLRERGRPVELGVDG